MTEAFFEEEVGRGGVARDSSGNAMLLPKGLPLDSVVRASYTSASSLADEISDMRHITVWEKRYLCRAMGMYEDLAALAATETYNTAIGMPEFGKRKTPAQVAASKANTASGRRLDDIIERATDRLGIHEKADYGTAVHAFTEPGNPGIVPERMKPDVDSFWTAIADNGIKLLDTEAFMANDVVMSAGTFDHLAWVPGLGNLVCDKKTGRMDAHHFGVQLSVYTNGECYDKDTHERTTLEEKYGVEINRSYGLVFAIKDGVTDMKLVDLEIGWKGAQVAAEARDYNAETGILADYDIKKALKKERDWLGARVMEAFTNDSLTALYHDYKHIWNDDLTQIAKHRRSELAAA